MSPRKILMLTNSEYGQANVFISTAHALIEKDRDVKIHIASFPILEKVVREALDSDGRNDGLLTFHSLPGPTMVECLLRDKEPTKNMMAVSQLKPGFKSAPVTIRFLVETVLSAWEASELAMTFAAVCDLIRDLEPDVVVVDTLFVPAMTAGRHMREQSSGGFLLAALSPNSVYDFVGHTQGLAAQMLRWPMVGTALPLPVPWYYVPLNVYCFLLLVRVLVGNRRRADLEAETRRLTGLPDLQIKDGMELVMTNFEGVDRIFVGSSPEVDLPDIDLSKVPKDYLDKLTFCGPILRPPSEIDPDLGSWLKKGRVVYINLGTHYMVLEEEALDIARSLRHMFDEDARRNGDRSGLRVLWKLKRDLSQDNRDFGIGPGSQMHEILGREMDEARVRIVEWLTSEPNSILGTGEVICSVTHGGANSFYEAIRAGVAQLVLPPWYDCYDYANKVEVLGVGRWGSKEGCPGWKVSELKKVLVDVVLDRNDEYTAKARRLASVCREGGEGRETAAEGILKLGV
ncbi:hypothetical protein ACJ41O_010727 [Fusarium nematophilum]